MHTSLLRQKFVTGAVMAISLVLAACGGGGGGSPGGSGSTGGGGGGGTTPGSQGTLTSPVVLSASAAYTGSVALGANSYYQFTGLAGGAAYSVTFSNISGAILPIISSNTSQSCFYSTVTGTASCIVQASPTGTVSITVADFSLTASTYTISAALAVDAGQGLPTAPVAFALGTTYSGALTSGVSTTTYDTGNSGYYSLTGLTSYHKYNITLTASVGGAQLLTYQNSYAAQACGYNPCAVTALGTSLLLQVRATDHATFTITATDLGAVTPYATQGTTSSPAVLQLDAASVLNNGSVNYTKSYYTVTRLVPGQRYYAYMSTLGDNVNLYVYNDAAYSQLACASTNTGTANESCVATANATGQLWIVADGSLALQNLGSVFSIGLQRIAPTQGTSAAPQLINSATDLPFRVSYGNAATSYYKITGLAANTTLMVTLAPSHIGNGTLSGYLSTYAPTGFSTIPACGSTNSMNNVYEECTATTSAAGELYLTLDGSYSPSIPGGTDYINVKPLPVNEGTSTAPLAKNMSTTVPANTFTGQVAGGSTGYSYYALTNLTPNTAYYILASFGDGESASTTVFNTFITGDLTKEALVCSNSWSTLNTGCVATSDASGRLWVTIGGWYSDFGTNFTVEALPAPTNQGTAAAPLSVAPASLPYRATVAAGGTSYYSVSGLTAGSEYFFTKYDTSGGEYLAVYNDLALTQPVCYGSSGSSRASSCRGTPTGTAVYIAISNTGYATVPSYYRLNVSLVPPAEGSMAAPVAYTTSGALYAGKVNVGASYYHATLAPNTLYTISLGTVAGDPDLYVFNSSAMTSAACSSIKGQNVVETCQATSDASGNLWITVDGELSSAGGTYQLKIQ